MSEMEHEPFHRGELAAQQRWRTADLWDTARKDRLLWDHIPGHLLARVEAAPFFFLATSAPDGSCDCSFKGGGPGLIRMLDQRRFAFPDFDGNGAFMSLGNILLNPRVGCLFIDFSDGARLRVNGRASIHEDGPLLDLFPQQHRVVLVDIEQVVPNCARHIPRLQSLA
ncbi:MAG: pyridoxamine 5'-phosphate oxidase family protein [Steroidobacteraceae bacterium]|nr:pyridoxamine 5'-phosphate oxidase family protein [Steroidobacteraceae bacterium]MBP7013852.1 pyridoxamine 5'-phosphate oxidase family protein [Steroidobacteraceae bacterium]